MIPWCLNRIGGMWHIRPSKVHASTSNIEQVSKSIIPLRAIMLGREGGHHVGLASWGRSVQLHGHMYTPPWLCLCCLCLPRMGARAPGWSVLEALGRSVLEAPGRSVLEAPVILPKSSCVVVVELVCVCHSAYCYLFAASSDINYLSGVMGKSKHAANQCSYVVCLPCRHM